MNNVEWDKNQQQRHHQIVDAEVGTAVKMAVTPAAEPPIVSADASATPSSSSSSSPTSPTSSPRRLDEREGGQTIAVNPNGAHEQPSTNPMADLAHSRRAPQRSFWRQLASLSRREMIDNLRNPQIIWFRMAQVRCSSSSRQYEDNISSSSSSSLAHISP